MAICKTLVPYWDKWSRVRANQFYILGRIILIAYSGYFQGLAPTEGVSWESHLFGALSGLFLAFLFKNVKVEDLEDELDLPREQTESYAQPFFDKDTFIYTKEQRFYRSIKEEE